MSIGVRDVGNSLEMAADHSGLRSDVEGPGLGIHAAPGGSSVGAPRVSKHNEVRGTAHGTNRDSFVEAKIGIGLIPGLLGGSCQVPLVVVVAVIRVEPRACLGWIPRRRIRALEYVRG